MHSVAEEKRKPFRQSRTGTAALLSIMMLVPPPPEDSTASGTNSTLSEWFGLWTWRARTDCGNCGRDGWSAVVLVLQPNHPFTEPQKPLVLKLILSFFIILKWQETLLSAHWHCKIYICLTCQPYVKQTLCILSCVCVYLMCACESEGTLPPPPVSRIMGAVSVQKIISSIFSTYFSTILLKL